MNATAHQWSPLWPELEPRLRAVQPARFRWPRVNGEGWVGPLHSPLREDRNPSFSVRPDSETDPGAWVDHGTGETGSVAELAQALGLDPRRSRQDSASQSGEQTLEAFARRRHLDLETLRSTWRVTETTWQGRPALRFPTRLGVDRIKFLDSAKPKAAWARSGGGAHWYGLPVALKHGGREGLYLVNGEPSLWAAAQAGVPAVCLAAGETAPSAELVAELAQAGVRVVRVVYDRDAAGRKGARAAVEVLRAGSLEAVALELPPDLGEHGDVDDLHRRTGDAGLAGALAALPVLVEDDVHVTADPAPTRPGDPWPGELPLHRDLPPAEPFPVEALGDVLGSMALAIHQVVRSPLATCGQAVAAAAAVAAQAHVNVEVDGRRSPVSDNWVTVADSGERKSGTDRPALAPHRRRQERLAEVYGGDFAAFAADLEAWKAAKAEALKRAKGREAKREALLDLGPEPRPPLSPIILCSEPSLEGLKKALATGQPSMGLFSDEGAQFVNGFSMADDRRLGTLGGLSKLWDGDPLDRVRAGDGAALLYGRRVSSHLMLQPVAAERLLGDPLAAGQGYLARCLVTWPESALGSMMYVEEDLNDRPETRRYFARLSHLLEADPPTGEDRQELRPRSLVLAPDAKRTWISFHDWCQRQLVAEGPLRPVRAFAAKAPEHALRLAGVLTAVEDLSAGAISLHNIEAGIVLARFYLEEALRLRAVGETAPDLIAAAALLEWLKSRSSRLVPVREVYRLGPNAVRDKATAQKLLTILADHGWVRHVGEKTIDETRHREVWEVRP